MEPLGIALAVGVVAAALGFVLGRSLERARRRRDTEAARDEASLIRKQAETDAANLRRATAVEAKEEAFRLRESWEAEETRRRADVKEGEQQLREERRDAVRRSDQLDQREQSLLQRQRALNERADGLESEGRVLAARRDEVALLRTETMARLEAAAGMSAEEARAALSAAIEDEAKADAANTVRELKEEARRTADREAKRLVAMAIQRMASHETAQLTVSVLHLPSDDMKGRIIGREGRNVRAFEHATGINVVIDDTPEAVVLSGYDPVRREVARLALARLVEDGRIHPARIEEAVAKAGEDVAEQMRAAAEDVLYRLGVHGVPDEIVEALGRLKFRMSYGQNQLAHSYEVGALAGIMAGEMGLDADIAKRAGVLHDVGKALTHEQEDTHVELGHRLCKRCGESDVVLNAIRAHHGDEPHRYAEAWLVSAADAISGSRPGSRREMFESFVERLEKLEEIAMEHPGVERSYAIQAGRELRVMVQPDQVSDEAMARMSEDVARKIEETVQYPGQIKVVVIRETRSVDFAR